MADIKSDNGLVLTETESVVNKRTEYVLEYMNKSADAEALSLWLTKNTLKTDGKPGLDGFTVIQESDGPRGVEGVPGVYRFEARMKQDLSPVEAGGCIASPLAERFLVAFLKESLRFVKCDFLPNNKNLIDKKDKGYPHRKREPILRLFFSEKGEERFADLPLNIFIEDIDKQFSSHEKDTNIFDRWQMDGVTRTSLTELLLNGPENAKGILNLVGDKLIGGSLEEIDQLQDDPKAARMTTYPVSMLDTVNAEMEEPVFLSLSMVRGEKPNIHADPRAFAHCSLAVDDDGRLRAVSADFPHMVDGSPALNKFLVPVFRRVFDSDDHRRWTEIKRPSVKKLSAEDIAKNGIEMLEIPFDSKSKDQELSFGEDKLMLEFCKMVGAYRFDVKLNMGKYWNSVIVESVKKSSESGKMSTFLEMLLVSDLLFNGEAAIAPVEGPDGKLEIVLGPGNHEMMVRLKEILAIVKDLPRTDRDVDFGPEFIKKVHSFWKFWKENNWHEEISNEIDSASNGDGGTITRLAEIVGVDNRPDITKLSSLVASKLATLVMVRRLVSTLGRVPGPISEHVKSLYFDTAAGASNNSISGFIGETISSRYFARDPFVWAEACAMLIDNDDQFRQSLVKTASGLVRDGEKFVDMYKKLGITDRAMQQVGTWLLSMDRGKNSSQATFGSITDAEGKMYEVPMDAYLTTAGETVQKREEAINATRALVTIMKIAIKENKLRDWDEKLVEVAKKVVFAKSVQHFQSLLLVALISRFNFIDGKIDDIPIYEITPEDTTAIKNAAKMIGEIDGFI